MRVLSFLVLNFLTSRAEINEIEYNFDEEIDLTRDPRTDRYAKINLAQNF